MAETKKSTSSWSETATNLASESSAALEILKPSTLLSKPPESVGKELEMALQDPNLMGSIESTEMDNMDNGESGSLLSGHNNGSNELSIPGISSKSIASTSKELDIVRKLTNKTKKEPKNPKKLDQYGFITNLDNQGILRDENFHGNPGGAATPNNTRTPKKKKKMSKREIRQRKKFLIRRERKWVDMLDNWNDILDSQKDFNKMRSRVRKGIPNTIRGRAWSAISNAHKMVSETHVGVYQDLVDKSCSVAPAEEDDSDDDSNVHWYEGNHVPHNFAEKVNQAAANNNNGDIMKDTIERDINRTFPRHSMFYVDGSETDSDEDTEDYSFDNCSIDTGSVITTEGEDQYADEVEVDENGGVVPAWAQGVIERAASNCVPCTSIPERKSVDEGPFLDLPAPQKEKKNIKKKEKKPIDLKAQEGGQASLRRVLRAYSIYDSEVGYCQGMNFIAAMFITCMSEEEAFWVLASSMNKPPCQMRGLFGEGMSEAHQVLYVADCLIAHFLPKLFKHLKKENVHITMFATQWLLTIFTSSFPFDIVTRVWDCFLVEGWKVAYRVMIALLDASQSDLLKLRFEDILGYLKELPNNVECDALLTYAFKIPLRKRQIEKYAKKWEKSQKKK